MRREALLYCMKSINKYNKIQNILEFMQLPPPTNSVGKATPPPTNSVGKATCSSRSKRYQDRNVKVFEQLNRISTCSKVGCLEEEGAW